MGIWALPGAGWESCPVLGWLNWEAGGILLPSFGIYTVTEEPSPVPFSLNGSEHSRVLHFHLCPFPTKLQERTGMTVRWFHSCGVSSWASPEQDKARNMEKSKKSTFLLLPRHDQELICPFLTLFLSTFFNHSKSILSARNTFD